jgi:hypothetical protein
MASGIKPMTFWLVPKHLNHYTTHASTHGTNCCKTPTSKTISVIFTLQSNVHSFSALSSYSTLFVFEPAFIWGSYAKIRLKFNHFEDTILLCQYTANNQHVQIAKRLRKYRWTFTCCFWYAVSGWILDSNNSEPENVNIYITNTIIVYHNPVHSIQPS